MALPLPKKQLEGALAAAGDWVRVLTVVELLVAASADVLEGLALLEPVVVRAFFFAARIVKIHADLIVAHILLRNTINVLLTLRRRILWWAAGVG